MSDELQTQALLGDDAEKFVSSEVGQAMQRLANEDADAAVLAFSDVDISDLAKVAKIQQDLRVAMRFPGYLAELAQRGREALVAYEQQERSKKEPQ